MRFMMLMIPKGYETAKPGAMPDAEAVAAMMKYNESLQKAGVLLALDGLHVREVPGLAHLRELVFGRVQPVDVSLVVEIVVEPHGLLVDMRLQRGVIVRQWRKGMSHDSYSGGPLVAAEVGR